MYCNLPTAFALAAILMLNGGCSSSKKDNTALSPKPPILAGTSALHGSSWQLISLNRQPPNLETELTLNFINHKISGTSGCNTYTGPYTETGSKEISIGQLTATTRKCVPPERMEQEWRFIAMLRSAVSFTLDGSRLTLKTDNGTAAVFKPQSQELKGTAWRVVSYSDGQGGLNEILSKGRSLTAVFSTDGRFSGSAGCNSYTAVFTGSPQSKVFSFNMTEMSAKQCPFPDIMEQEGSFMAALYSAVSYFLDDRTLTLNDADGNPVVIFSRL